MKNNKILYVIIIVLVAIVCLLSGFILGNGNLFNKEQENNSEQVENNDENIGENKEIITELNLSSTLVTSLSSAFHGKFLTTEISTYDNYFYKQNKTVIANIPDALKKLMTFYSLNIPSSVSDSEFEKAYKQIFGSSATVPNVEIENVCEPSYEHVNGIYKLQESSCGAALGEFSYSKLIKAQQIQNSDVDKIVISEAVVFMSNDEKLYKDLSHTEFVQDYSFVAGKNPLNSLDTSKFAQYDYTFVKNEAGIYVFTSVERIK